MNTISFEEFARAYEQTLQEILAHLSPRMQAEIARHNYGWRQGATDFAQYLRISSYRFYTAYQVFSRWGTGSSLCDIGGFWGVFPVTLSRLGFQVAMTEAVRFYGNAFDPLFRMITREGVTIVDCNPFEEVMELESRFDCVTAMAVIEHYPHSLKVFMQNVTSLLKPKAPLYLEVPNIASWRKRVEVLRGRTPLVPVTDIYRSATPFTGHHHEFTMAELEDLVALSGLTVVARYYHCFPPFERQWPNNSPATFISAILRRCREIIAVACQ